MGKSGGKKMLKEYSSASSSFDTRVLASISSARSLLLLQKQGLIKLKDPNNILATAHDVIFNPKHLKSSSQFRIFIKINSASMDAKSR